MSRLKGVLAVLLLGILGFIGVHVPAFAEDTITIANSGEPPTLDPNLTFNGYSFLITNSITETLLSRDEEGIKPRLAVSWKLINDTTWRFTLRSGVKFHDGTPFDADAVKFMVERLTNPANKAPGGYVLEAVSQVRVVNDTTVDIISKKPFAPLLAHFTHPVTAIVSPKAVGKHGKDFGRNPVGTGPFAFKSWAVGDQVTLVRNKSYWGGAPKVDGLVFRTIPEVGTQLVELRNGGVDVIGNIPPDKFVEIDKNAKIEAEKRLGWNSTFLGYNTKSGPTADVRVRRAIAMAIDRDAMVTQLRRGMAVKATAPIPKTVWGSARSIKPWEYDVKEAKELLNQAGYGKGFKIDLLAYENAELRQLAEAIQFQLQQIGITVNVRVVDYTMYKEEVQRKDHGLFLSGWGTVTYDADYALFALFHSTEAPLNNNSFYSNPKVDSLLTKGRTTDDTKARQEAYQEAQEIINSELPMLTLYYSLFSFAKRTEVKGESIPAWIFSDYSNAYINK